MRIMTLALLLISLQAGSAAAVERTVLFEFFTNTS